MKLSWKPKVDGNDYVPNANVNDDGNANVNDSNVQNENAARLQMRLMKVGVNYERLLLSQPPSIRRASVSFAWILRQFVSLTSFNSNINLICKLNTSAFACALIKNCSLIALGACLAVNNSDNS